MATEVVHTIKPGGGGDYTTLSAWEAAQQRDLVAADEIAVAECYIGSYTGTLNLAGWTTDATRYSIIRAASANGHGGIPGAGFKISNNTSTITITITNHTGRIIGIEISNTSTGSAISVATGAAGRQTWIEGCLIGPSNPTAFTVTAETEAFINNNILFGNVTNGIFVNTGLATAHAYNNTVIGSTNGIRRASGTLRPKNNIVQGGTTCFNGTMTASETNISSDATSPQTGLRSITLTFVNAGANDYHLESTDTAAIGAGTDLSADANLPFSTDIDGNTRTSPWDIGADERAATGVTELSATDTPLVNDQTVRTIEAAQVGDGALLPDQAARTIEAGRIDPLLLADDIAATVETATGVTELSATDTPLVNDQAARTIEAGRIDPLLLADDIAATVVVMRDLTDGLSLIDLIGLIRQHQIENDLLLFDQANLSKELQLLDQMLLADAGEELYFPSVVDFLTGVRMGRIDIMGVRGVSRAVLQSKVRVLS